MKVTHLLILACSCLSLGQTGFRIEGTKIIDPNGLPFIVKGVNVTGEGSDWGNTTLTDKDLITKTWKFNTIRIYSKLYKDTHVTMDHFHSVVESFSASKIVCLLDAHDKIGGYYQDAQLNDFKDFWRDMATRYKNNTYVWFDLCNEPGSQTTNQALWTNMYREAIKVIRDEVGATNIILIEGGAWGQDAGDWGTGDVSATKSAILQWGNDVKTFNGKTYANIGMSIHIYDQYKYGGAKRISNFIKAINDRGHALVVGEWGSWNNKECVTAMRAFAEVIKTSDVGRIVWHWAGGDDNKLCGGGGGRMVSLDAGGKPTNLSELGTTVWDDTHVSGAVRVRYAVHHAQQTRSHVPTTFFMLNGKMLDITKEDTPGISSRLSHGLYIQSSSDRGERNGIQFVILPAR